MPSPARLLPPFLTVLLAAGCVAPPEPAPPPPPPAPVRVVPPPAVSNWEDRRPAPGQWRYARGVATLGTGAASLACRRDAGSVILTVPGAAGPATIRTTSATRQVSLETDGSARFAARDPLLDAMAFSRGRFTIERAGAPPLTLPAQAEIGRVIEDCRG